MMSVLIAEFLKLRIIQFTHCLLFTMNALRKFSLNGALGVFQSGRTSLVVSLKDLHQPHGICLLLAQQCLMQACRLSFHRNVPI
mmetsp:Transcript_16815/g.54758  ORF Transcript_16815/g.54758 Transcript_16815/m.54758 type:complete len:84 (-) Transcript_16815:638-889(-)